MGMRERFVLQGKSEKDARICAAIMLIAYKAGAVGFKLDEETRIELDRLADLSSDEFDKVHDEILASKHN